MARLKEDLQTELEIKKSRFLCYLHASTSEEDAKDFIQQIKKHTPMPRIIVMLLSLANKTKSNAPTMMENLPVLPVFRCLMS